MRISGDGQGDPLGDLEGLKPAQIGVYDDP